jgi:hypothetical protein
VEIDCCILSICLAVTVSLFVKVNQAVGKWRLFVISARIEYFMTELMFLWFPVVPKHELNNILPIKSLNDLTPYLLKVLLLRQRVMVLFA